MIERNAQAQGHLISDLLDIAQIVTGRVRLDRQPAGVAPIVTAALESVRPTADGKGIALASSIDLDVEPVFIDPQRFQQVVLNLLTNAVKFTPAGGAVEVALGMDGGGVRLSVRDTGIGIPADFLPQVFEPFRQGEAALTRPERGLGLGLAIVRHLVELHHGTVRAESPGPGAGATFTVVLPPASDAMSRTRAALPRITMDANPPAAFDCPPVLEGVRILVVEDDEDIRALIATVLRECRAIVSTATTTTEARVMLERERHDILLLDIGLPKEDGLAFMARERHRLVRGVRTIALTAHVRADVRARASALGFDAYLSKPVDPAVLIGAITALVRVGQLMPPPA